MHAQVGDEIVVDTSTIGVPPRKGRILDVRVSDGEEHYEVEWDDGHVSIFFPSSTAHVVHLGKGRKAPESAG